MLDAIHLIKSQNYDNVSISLRKSLESDVIVVTYSRAKTRNISCVAILDILCYFPRESRWCKLGEPRGFERIDFIFGRDELHSYEKWPCSDWEAPTLVSYNPYSNSIIQYVSKPSRSRLNWVLREIFVVNDDEIYARVSERRGGIRDTENVRGNKCVSFITTYKVESNSWKEVTSFDFLDAREDICIVARGDFVFFIGGEERLRVRHGRVVRESITRYTDVHRYNLSKNQWNRVADFLRPKIELSGAACNGRIFITGRVAQLRETCQCEVYSERTNEWQFIASLNIRPGIRAKLLSVDGQLYALGCSYTSSFEASPSDTKVECYHADKNEWIWKTRIPIPMSSYTRGTVNAHPARVFKGLPSNSQLKSYNPWRFSPSAWPPEANEGKCGIM